MKHLETKMVQAIRIAKWRNRIKSWESWMETLYHRCVSVPNGKSYIQPYEWTQEEINHYWEDEDNYDPEK